VAKYCERRLLYTEDMTDSRYLHPVSTKAVLFSPDHSEVLVMKYLWDAVKDTYGFPGGHVEEHERPDDALRRELKEELNIESIDLKREDFWMHENGKIVLLYSGVIPRDMIIAPSQPEGEIGQWVAIEDIANDIIPVRSYKEAVLRLATRT
jgi:8-oxo-dGTP pyrophosphatase MutT (NUDIX family)